MCTTNRQRRKKLILAYPDTRRLYRMMQVLAVFLVVATICIFAVGKWSEKQIKEKNDQLFGRWNEVFLNVDEEDVEYFRQHAFVDDYSIQNIQEKIYLEGDDRIIIGTCDDNFFELGNLEMVDGRMPVNEGEVAIEEEYLDALGVEKVGDNISEGVNIDSLKGYKVCGIVKDYSSRWKMVNWDVKYINCFISDAKVNEIQIYASLSSVVQQDIETNMLEYRENVGIDFNILPDILNLWVILCLIQLVLYFKIQVISRQRIGIDHSMISRVVSRIQFFSHIYSKYIFAIVLKILIIFLITGVVNNIVSKTNYMDNLQLNSLYYNNEVFDDYFIDLESDRARYIMLNEIEYIPWDSIQYIPNMGIVSRIQVLISTFWLSFLLYLYFKVFKQVLIGFYKLYEEEHFLLNYFFGKKSVMRSNRIKCFSIYLISEQILTIFSTIGVYQDIIRLDYILHNYKIICCWSAFLLFSQIIYSVLLVRKSGKSMKWLLTTEFE